MRQTPYPITLLQLKTTANYQENLERLLHHIKASSSKLIVAPEVCLTGFDYENFEKAAAFFEVAIEAISAIVDQQIVVLTLIKKEHGNFVNQAVVIHQQKIVYQQNKYKLFTVGEETKQFTPGEQNAIVPFEIEGVKYALLICFELRFKELWRQLEGVDILLAPSLWGKPRKQHLEVLSQALAIMNQCFVAVANSANEDMAKSSAIISPWGDVVMDDTKEVIHHTIDLKEVKKIRRLIPMR
jgi:predicted amidohydrolase